VLLFSVPGLTFPAIQGLSRELIKVFKQDLHSRVYLQQFVVDQVIITDILMVEYEVIFRNISSAQASIASSCTKYMEKSQKPPSSFGPKRSIDDCRTCMIFINVSIGEVYQRGATGWSLSTPKILVVLYRIICAR
jgi:hypothetical protein